MTEKEKLVNSNFIRFLKNLESNSYYQTNAFSEKEILLLTKDVLLGVQEVPSNFCSVVKDNRLSIDLLNECIFGKNEYWGIDFLISLLSPYKKSENEWDIKRFQGGILNLVLNSINSRTDLTSIFKKLNSQSFDELAIWEIVIYFNGFEVFYKDDNLTFLGDYILEKINNNSRNFLGFRFGEDYSQLLKFGMENSNIIPYFKFCYKFFPDFIEENILKIILFKDSWSDKRILDAYKAVNLYNLGFRNYNSKILEIIKVYKEPYEGYLLILFSIAEYFPSECNSLIYNVYDLTLSEYRSRKYFDRWLQNSEKVNGSLSYNLLKWFIKKNDLENVKVFLRETLSVHNSIPGLLSEKLGEDSIIYLIQCLSKEKDNYFSSFNDYNAIFNELIKYNCDSIENFLWEFVLKTSNKNDRKEASKVIATQTSKSYEKSIELLIEGKTNERTAAALVLSFINSTEAIKALKDTLDLEKSDDARDIIMEALAESIYSKQLSKSELQQIISFADKRGKLNKFNEKWLEEAELAPLYWQEGGEAFTPNEVRFLFYRMNRAKGINSDIEARQIINAIDKEKSIKFTKQLIKAFADTGSDTKFKHYLTTAGQLGGNEILPTISSIFRQNLADKRIKMAEYTVEALGMIGTNKALRQVEVISRKFANKRPSISQKALLVLEAASVELHISSEELSDRIIPDFDFEGLYKPFEVGDETYRAFINTDFSLCYFDEDNKIKKTLPKGISSEQKAEFKEIEKELKEVVKGQKGRFEKFFVEERRWTSEAWISFFQEHPMMFVYTRKLVWGIFDENQNLKNCFYCSDDTSLYDLEDDEVELQDGDFVGLVHPIYLTAETLKKWKDKLYDMSLVTIFPQLDRKVFLVEDSEKDSDISKLFYNTEIPKGADFVSSNVEKMGWYKSNSDGGSLDLTKKQIPKGITAYIYIEGVMAWYQDGNAKATIYEVTFRGRNWNEKLLLKDLPPVFYSETMADIDSLINA